MSKYSSMKGTAVWSSEDLNTERNALLKARLKKVGSRDSFGKLTRVHECFVRAKNLSSFYPCHKTA